MRFDFTIYGDNANEVRESMLAIASAMPKTLLDRPGQSFQITVEPDWLKVSKAAENAAVA